MTWLTKILTATKVVLTVLRIVKPDALPTQGPKVTKLERVK